MKEKWNLKNSKNINQMLRIRNDIDSKTKFEEFPHLVIVKHNFHIADDIMFPDPACLAFFTAFENNHLDSLEDEGKLILSAVDICEGLMQFYIYCRDPQQTVYDCIAFLKSNDLYSCEFEVITEEKGKRMNLL